jgi:hypothetical protein
MREKFSVRSELTNNTTGFSVQSARNLYNATLVKHQIVLDSSVLGELECSDSSRTVAVQCSSQ